MVTENRTDRPQAEGQEQVLSVAWSNSSLRIIVVVRVNTLRKEAVILERLKGFLKDWKVPWKERYDLAFKLVSICHCIVYHSVLFEIPDDSRIYFVSM